MHSDEQEPNGNWLSCWLDALHPYPAHPGREVESVVCAITHFQGLVSGREGSVRVFSLDVGRAALSR